MGSVRMSDERKFLAGLKKLFNALINGVKDGTIGTKELPGKAREFLNSDEVNNYLNRLVGRMTKTLRVDSAKDWRDAATKGGNGPLLYRIIKEEMKGPVGERIWELIADNVAYIKTVPQEWAEYISSYAAREALKGKRPEQIEAEIRKIMPAHMTKNLKCIARTECAKANAAIVQARAEMCGIRCYFWRCVKDNRVRDSHWDMDGILVFYDDPPSPEELFPQKGTKPYGHYHAGNTFNCRCYMEVVVDGRFLPDTFRYYRAGSIQSTTRAAFLKKFGKIA